MLWDAAASQRMGPASAEPVSTWFLCNKYDLVHCAHSFIIFTLFTYLFVCDILGPKKMSAKDSGEKKRMKVKQEIIEKHELGVWCLSSSLGPSILLRHPPPFVASSTSCKCLLLRKVH